MRSFHHPPSRRATSTRIDRRFQRLTSDQIDESWIPWLASLAPWTHALTVTCKRFSSHNVPISETIVIDTARHFIRRINRRCFGRRSRRIQIIPVVVTYGWGCYGDHPHLHFCFSSPTKMSFDDFSSVLEEASRKTFWIDRERHIEPYRNEGWMKYLVEHGSDNLIVPLITPSSIAALL